MDELLAQHDDWEMEPLAVAERARLVEVTEDRFRYPFATCEMDIPTRRNSHYDSSCERYERVKN